ncbi:hypothetical protein [Vibrio harveyi]|uniref:hypothetical protein n=1 Tax=Vibrio harveyi TaxID=669 RepID=UPI0012AE2EF4|nr:hypothetical protein [Vibrio harveyi]EKO3862054.1 hypothetical protein [Vibrio harveyi]
MKCVDRLIYISIFISMVSMIINVAITITNTPDFIKTSNNQTFHSNTINFTTKGDVFFIEDLHTLNYSPILHKRSYTTRIIEGEKSKLFMNYQINFYDKDLITFSNINLPNGKNFKDSIDIETHNLQHLDKEIVKIIYQEDGVLCYNTLLDGNIKCLTRKI